MDSFIPFSLFGKAELGLDKAYQLTRKLEYIATHVSLIAINVLFTCEPSILGNLYLFPSSQDLANKTAYYDGMVDWPNVFVLASESFFAVGERFGTICNFSWVLYPF